MFGSSLENQGHYDPRTLTGVFLLNCPCNEVYGTALVKTRGHNNTNVCVCLLFSDKPARCNSTEKSKVSRPYDRSRNNLWAAINRISIDPVGSGPTTRGRPSSEPQSE